MANNGSQTAKFPAIFISHGMPLMALAESPTHFYLKELGKKLGRPEAIVCISAHWETVIPMLSGPANPETIHDFHGFPRPLYEIQYPSPGAPDLAQKIDDLFSESKIESRIDPERGLDHGAWVPLYLMYPQADIPVVQLSVQGDSSPESHFRLGEILSPLRDQGVLIMGSGGAARTTWRSSTAERWTKTPNRSRSNSTHGWKNKSPEATPMRSWTGKSPPRSRKKTTRTPRNISCPSSPHWVPQAGGPKASSSTETSSTASYHLPPTRGNRGSRKKMENLRDHLDRQTKIKWFIADLWEKVRGRPPFEGASKVTRASSSGPMPRSCHSFEATTRRTREATTRQTRMVWLPSRRLFPQFRDEPSNFGKGSMPLRSRRARQPGHPGLVFRQRSRNRLAPQPRPGWSGYLRGACFPEIRIAEVGFFVCPSAILLIYL